MRLITFQYRDDVFTGVLRDENIYPLPWSDLKHTAAAGMVAVEQAAAAAQPLPLANVRLLAPIRQPGKIIAIGLNYMDHCREQNLTPPQRPTIFAKFPTAVNDPGGEIRWHPALTQAVDYEAELAVIIGKKAYGVAYGDAYDYVLGYTCLNDVTARDLQRDDKQWVRGKSLDTFCPMGPMIVTPDEIPDPHQLAIRCWVNGELRQDSHTSQLIYNVPALIAICSAAFTLEPGDVITTGTPGGVGVFRNPPVFLQPGDRIEVEIEHIGRLQNTVGPYLGKQA
ncbi:MAG: fumarylacetoacetate hydrolase family protein [Chloroflexi bacterium]|nr:fumarylacetoacetate hydrolase family protein [Chloroflexota bacterium]